MGGWSGGWDFGEKNSLGALPGARMFSLSNGESALFADYGFMLCLKNIRHFS